MKKFLVNVEYLIIILYLCKKETESNALTMEELTTEVTEEDIKNGIEDEFGVVYSRDGKRLLTTHNRNLDFYEIKQGTIIICNNAFNNSGYLLRTIIIPQTIKMIGVAAFKFCESLNQISIHNSVSYIGDYAFCGCYSLRTFVIPNSISKIGDYLFHKCHSLEEIVIPDSVTTIGKCAFFNCNSLKQIIIPDSIKVIDDYAFNECVELEYFSIPKAIQTIGNNPFGCCWKLNLFSKSPNFLIENDFLICNHNILISYLGQDDSIVIPDAVSIIGDSAFQYCNTIKQIAIPNYVSEIRNSAFYECHCLQEITLPNSITSINDEVFYECTSLKSIRIPNSIQKIGNSAFFFCKNLRSITIPDSVTEIGKYAFWGCELLHQIDIPNSVSIIGEFAFRDCKSLQQINIPDSVTSIGECIFNRCDSLKPIIAAELSHRIRENRIISNNFDDFVQGLKIKKMIIKNYRAFVDLQISFNDFNCIVGKNDSGKSTIFSALEWFFNRDEKLNEEDLNSGNNYFVEKITQYVTIESYEIEVEVYFNGNFNSFADKDCIDRDGCVCVRKKMSFKMRDNKDILDMNYSIKKFIFKRMGGKAISDCSFDDLCIEYKKIASKSDDLLDQIQQIEASINQENNTFDHKNIANQIREKLYQYYSNDEHEEVWSDSWCLETILNSYKFNLYASNTSLSEYLNDLLQIKYLDSINVTKSQMAKDLSEMLNENNIDNNIRFKSNEINNLFSNDNVLLCSGNIPLKNRGEGIQLQIKNAIFKILTDLKSHNQNMIFAFEEPETHLHPSAQIEMYETIKKLSENPTYQVLITTHSPYIVKQLAKDNIQPIVVRRYENLKVSKISKLDERVLPYISMNEINYIAFDEPSIEYHIELFGYIAQKIEKDAGGVDIWLCNNKLSERKYDFYQVNSKTGQLVPDEKHGGFQHSDKTLPYCVRNQIDHPNEKNRQYESRDYIRCSIDIMRKSILNNPDLFHKKVS